MAKCAVRAACVVGLGAWGVAVAAAAFAPLPRQTPSTLSKDDHLGYHRSWGWQGQECGADADAPSLPAFSPNDPAHEGLLHGRRRHHHPASRSIVTHEPLQQESTRRRAEAAAPVVAISLSSPVPPWATAAAVSNILAHTTAPTFVILHASHPWSPPSNDDARDGRRGGSSGSGVGEGVRRTGGDVRRGAAAVPLQPEPVRDMERAAEAAAYIPPTAFEGLGVSAANDPWRALCPSRDGAAWRLLPAAPASPASQASRAGALGAAGSGGGGGAEARRALAWLLARQGEGRLLVNPRRRWLDWGTGSILEVPLPHTH